MKQTESHLLEIIRCGTGMAPKPLAINDAEGVELLKMALGHAVAGLTFAGLERLKAQNDEHTEIPKLFLLQCYLKAEQLKKLRLRFEKAIVAFAHLLTEEQIDYVVFKGLAVASHYPKPECRDMGDIDFYVPEWDFDRAMHLIEQHLKVQIEKDDIDKHFSFTWQGLRFEMHYQIETFGYRQYQSYFNEQIDHCIKDGLASFTIQDVQVPMLPPLWDIIVVFKHFMNHLIGEGVGLRQTTDMAVLVQCYQQKMDVEALQMHLRKIGYLKAFSAMVALVERYFGTSWEAYWDSDEGGYRKKAFVNADILMKDILKNGNFGRLDYRHHQHGNAKRIETTKKFFTHCFRYFSLAPREIVSLIPKRIYISLKAH